MFSSVFRNQILSSHDTAMLQYRAARILLKGLKGGNGNLLGEMSFCLFHIFPHMLV